MHWKIFTSPFILLLLLSSCAPNLYQLKAFDAAEALKSDTLYIIVQTDAEEKRLLEKYNQDTKAKRLQHLNNARIDKMISAIEKHYSFSAYKIWDLDSNQFEYPNGFYTEEVLYEVFNENSSDTKMSFQVKDSQHQIITSIETSFNPYYTNYNWLLKETNRRLNILYKNGKKLQEKKQ